MNYVKKFFKVHIRSWYIYIATVFLIGIGLFVSLLIGKYMSVKIDNIFVIRLACSIVFGVISSILTLIPNYLFSREICSDGKKNKALIVMSCAQFISVLFFVLIGVLIFFG